MRRHAEWGLGITAQARPGLLFSRLRALPVRAGMPWEAFGLQISLFPCPGMPARAH